MDLGENYDAQVCLNKAVKLDTNSFKARYNRGKCLLHLKYYDEAIADLLKAAGLKPKHAYVHDYLAEAYSALGDEGQAQNHRDIADELRNTL